MQQSTMERQWPESRLGVVKVLGVSVISRGKHETIWVCREITGWKRDHGIMWKISSSVGHTPGCLKSQPGYVACSEVYLTQGHKHNIYPRVQGVWRNLISTWNIERERRIGRIKVLEVWKGISWEIRIIGTLVIWSIAYNFTITIFCKAFRRNLCLFFAANSVR